MNKKVDLALVGATGIVGETVLEILKERNFPVGNFYPLASKRSKGSTVVLGSKPYLVGDVAEFDFSKAQIAIFSAGSEVSADYAPLAAKNKCIVIDNTSQFRYEDDIPLVVPEVNPQEIARYKDRYIIANPNCSTIQMVVALKPIYDAVGIKRIIVSTYQSVSGAGKEGLEELASQTSHLLNGAPLANKTFPHQISFNVIPHIDVFLDNGFTKEEMKMLWETQKIFGDKNVEVNATAVRVPVFYGHSESIYVETKDPISVEEVRRLLKTAKGVELYDEVEKNKYPTPVKQGTAKDGVFVGRIRKDIVNPRGLNLWVVADNVRKGAALNAIQIAEKLCEEYL